MCADFPDPEDYLGEEFPIRRDSLFLFYITELQRRRRSGKRENMGDILDELRSLMAANSPPLDALIVPSEDYHQSEYVSPSDARREFVSGFTGSAGVALVTMDDARLWTDGRYFVQATQELSDRWKLMRGGEDKALECWIADSVSTARSLAPKSRAAFRPSLMPQASASSASAALTLSNLAQTQIPLEFHKANPMLADLPDEATVGVDPWCVSANTAKKWENVISKKQQKLVQLSVNLVDKVWKTRPQAEINPVIIHPIKFAGRAVSDKLKDLRENLIKEKSRAIIVTTLDEVAWLFNIRGTDVPYCPVVHAFAIVTLNSAFFYVDKEKVSAEVQSYLEENTVEVRDYSAVGSDVALLASDQLKSATKGSQMDSLVNGKLTANGGSESRDLIWVDADKCCLALYSRLKSSQVFLQQSPLALAKALKNPVELDGLRNAHMRDGAAIVQYLAWLDKQMQENYGAPGYFLEPEKTCSKKPRISATTKLTEVSVSDKLETFRASKENFKGLSFPTISSVGPNAAMCHYCPVSETCLELDPDQIYLCDSGAQYQDGTTDITRTVHFGKPSAHEKACYTAVLKGHIALGAARFPCGTIGNSLDILARLPLWKYGLDYRHGTGHGIGSYLNVHEGPHMISFRPQAQNVPLQASMTVTDEPGYYEDGNFGIRLENLLVVKEANTKFNFGDKGYLSFEHITWAPYQKKLMDLSALAPDEIEWLNSYHSKCKEILEPYLHESDKAWLKKATEPISVA